MVVVGCGAGRTFRLVGLDTVIGCYSTLSGALNA